MVGKKLDFLMHMDGQAVPVKVRILETSECVFASFDRGMLHGWNAPLEQLDEMIEVLTAARAEVVKGAYAEST